VQLEENFEELFLVQLKYFLDCDLLEAWENMAFKYCPHGQDGFTWAEVQDCEVIKQHLFLF
jgi:hypothetical protein